MVLGSRDDNLKVTLESEPPTSLHPDCSSSRGILRSAERPGPPSGFWTSLCLVGLALKLSHLSRPLGFW